MTPLLLHNPVHPASQLSVATPTAMPSRPSLNKPIYCTHRCRPHQRHMHLMHLQVRPLYRLFTSTASHLSSHRPNGIHPKYSLYHEHSPTCSHSDSHHFNLRPGSSNEHWRPQNTTPPSSVHSTITAIAPHKNHQIPYFLTDPSSGQQRPSNISFDTTHSGQTCIRLSQTVPLILFTPSTTRHA